MNKRNIIIFTIFLILTIIVNLPIVSKYIFPADLIGSTVFGFGTGWFGFNLLFKKY